MIALALPDPFLLDPFLLPFSKDCQSADLKNAKYLEERVVNIPSSVRI